MSAPLMSTSLTSVNPLASRYANQFKKPVINDVYDPFVSYSTAALASGILTVQNSSAIHWQLISSHTGTVLDDLWLTK